MRLSIWPNRAFLLHSSGRQRMVHNVLLLGTRNAAKASSNMSSARSPLHARRYCAAIHHHLSRCNLILRNSRSEERTSELQSLMRISYAVFCLKKNITTANRTTLPRYTSHHETQQIDTQRT